MLKFKDFFALRESAGYGTQEGKRTVPVDEDTFLNLYEKNCKLYDPEKMQIYRGNRLLDKDNAVFAFCDPSQSSPRPSKNTYSFTMWLMESMEEWKKYPPRSKSLICSTGSNYASSYGDPFIIIPYDTAKIGVCNATDFFETVRDTTGGDVSTFNYFLMELIIQAAQAMIDTKFDEEFKVPKFISGSEVSYSGGVDIATKQDFFDILKTLDKFFATHPDYISPVIDNINRFYRSKTMKQLVQDGLEAKKSLYSILSENLTPEKNGFELFDMSNFNVEDIHDNIASDNYWGNASSEVWTDGPALMIKPTQFKSLILRQPQPSEKYSDSARF